MAKNYPILKKILPLFFLLFSIAAFSQTQTQTFTSSGTFTVPCDVTSITVEVWGGGGKGGDRSNKGESGGGGGAAYARSNFTVIPGAPHIVNIGSGSTSTAAGGDSWFISNTTILAKGGGSVDINTNSGAAGGSLAATIGDVKFAGGNGASSLNSTYGGGGGSSAGTLSIGTTAINQNGATAPAGGGNGGNGATSNNEDGASGLNPGGGGGGARNTGASKVGGNGGNGQIRITYTSNYCAPTFTTRVDPITNVTFAGINNTTTNATGGANLESFCITGTVVQGSATNAISLKGNTVGNNTDYFTVFIDWNQDGDFIDLGESFNIGTITNSTGIDTITLIGNIAVPATATLGNTRMRVLKNFTNYATNPCGTTNYGQAEDYTINVTAPRTITTGVISPTSYCVGSTVSVPYTITGTYTAGNIFTAQLSNASGSFTAPVNIGTLTTTGAGTISGTIPIGTAAGTGYRIRVVSSNPAVTGTNNGSNLTVNATPTAPTVGTITQPTCAIPTGSVVLNDLPSGNWTINPGAITGNTTSTTITGLAAGTYNYTVTNAGGCSSSASADVVINADPSNNVWNGSVNTDWNTAGNWCIGVPTIGVANSLNVLIQSGLTNYPIIAAGAVAGYVNTIVLENNTTLNVRENSLSVINDLTLNGNSKIDFEGESQLIQSTGSTFSGTGTIEIDQQGTGDSYNYNYWSSPVNSNLAAKTYSIGAVLRDGTDALLKLIDFGAAHTWADGVATPAFIKLSTYWMYKLENSKGYAAWTRIGNNVSIKVGEGYTMKGSNTAAAEQKYTFVGSPNNGDISLPIAVGNDYLVGNPYPSAIDAWEFIDDNLAHTGPLYFWEHSGGGTHNLSGYQGGYATYTKSGGVTAAVNGPVAGVSTSINATKVPGRYIPVGQAFFVVGETAGEIIFKNNQRVFEKESDGFSTFMKSSNTKLKTSNTRGADLRPQFRFGFDAPKISHRQLLLTIDEKATPAVDRGYEAEIYEIFVDDFYWVLDGKKYIIQATNHTGLNSEVPIGIQLSITGMVTVKIDALENVDDDTSIYLKDKVTGESFNMREKPVQLNLTAGKYADRFVLVFKTQKLVAEDVKAEVLIPATSQPTIEGIYVFMNNAIGELQIKNNSTEEIVSVTLINALGQTVKTWNSNFNIRTISLPISTATGVYLVQINTKTGKTVKKISVE